MWEKSQFNLQAKRKLKDQADYYKKKEYQAVQPIDPKKHDQNQQAALNQNYDIPVQQQGVSVDDQLKKLLLRYFYYLLLSKSYQHEKKVFEQIGNTMKYAFTILPESENLIFYFVLIKQYLILSNNLFQSLNQGNNLFANQYFNQFLKSEYFKDLMLQIQTQFNNLFEFFKLFLAQINQLMSTPNFNQKHSPIIKDLKEHANDNFQQSSFTQFYSQILSDYYLKINEKALNEEKNNLNEALKQYRLCYQILDCVLIPKNYPFEVKDKDGNIINFDFYYYNSRTIALGLEQIKKEIEGKFLETLSK